MWHVLGHINGNAIYNNNDEDFVEFVKYALARWDYKYPYDVALWATISDFPYSWPLWQRYSSKFVTTNLVSFKQKHKNLAQVYLISPYCPSQRELAAHDMFNDEEFFL